MNSSKLSLKIFLTADSAGEVDVEVFIGVFHRWIKEHVLPELVIDVASYSHVPQGPGVVLIGHGSDYFMDEGEGRLGLLHNRKRAGPPPADRLADLARRTLHAAWLLEREPSVAGRIRFATNELLFRINDRLAAKNDDATFAAARPEIESLGQRIFGGPFEIARVGGPKDVFSALITAREQTSLATLLGRVGGPPRDDRRP